MQRLKIRLWFRVTFSLLILLATPMVLHAQTEDTKRDGKTEKSIILHLLEGRTFEGERCSTKTHDLLCEGLIESLRTGEFEVVSPTEWSDKPDMPTYVKIRKQCTNLNLEYGQIQRGPTIKATKDFRLYKIEPSPRPGKSVWVFHARDYAIWGGKIILDDDGKPTIITGGYFEIFEVPGCKRLGASLLHDAFTGGSGRKNPFVVANDWANAVIRLREEYGTLSIYPILGDETPRECWRYRVEYSSWEPKRFGWIYGFSYKPPNCPDD